MTFKTGARLCTATCLLLLARGVRADEPLPRPEYPQPQAVRAVWQNLNGPWDFEFDDAQAGLAEHWQLGRHPFTRKITVPFPFQSRLSGIAETAFHHDIWQRRTFRLDEAFKGKRVLLHFGAVDYECKVWLNGDFVGSHRGGHVPFSFDVTHDLAPGENTIVVWARDTEDMGQPRGKQHWIPQPQGIFYTRTSGIWQTVWLEGVGSTYLKSFKMTPQIDSSALDVEVDVGGDPARWSVAAKVTLDGVEVLAKSFKPETTRFTLEIPSQRLWSPETPTLYDLTLTLTEKNGDSSRALDEVQTYFGMRKISVAGGRLLLNNQPYFQRLVLDQGYWPEGILAAPSDDALRFDVEMSKKFGFNGARKHQKIEDPRWHYWCDKLGYLVWDEMPNAAPGVKPDERVRAMFEPEWQASIERDYNHPCVVAWTPFNETWHIAGVRQDADTQAWVERVYNLTKRLDPLRPVCDNSGWEHTITDIADLHDYVEKGEDFVKRWNELVANGYRHPASHKSPVFFVDGKSYGGQPIVISEYGGIGLKTEQKAVIGSQTKAWSYGSTMEDVEAYFKRYAQITEAIQGVEAISGFCYTQLTDVEHEVNGVMTYDRKPKLDPARIKEINEKRTK